MENEKFTPEESFSLINNVLENTKKRYEENGALITTWGVITLVASITQYLMVANGLGDISGWAWVVTMIPMFIGTIIYSMRKGKRAQKGGMDISGAAWFMAGSMAMLTGFIFGNKFGIAFTTVMFLPFCLAALITGVYLKKQYLIIISILAAVLAYGALYIPFKDHPLVVAGMALLLFIIPGLLLRADYKKRNV